MWSGEPDSRKDPADFSIQLMQVRRLLAACHFQRQKEAAGQQVVFCVLIRRLFAGRVVRFRRVEAVMHQSHENVLSDPRLGVRVLESVQF